MKSRPLLVRLGGALIGLVGFFVFSYLFMPRTVDLTVILPPDAPAVRSLSVRVTNTADDVEAYKGRRTRPEPGRSMLFRLKLPRGMYRVTAWSEPLTWENTFRYDGEDFAEVHLAPK